MKNESNISKSETRRPRNLTPWRLKPTAEYLAALRQADEAVFAVLSRGLSLAKKCAASQQPDAAPKALVHASPTFL